jgi:hypothetical protein
MTLLARGVALIIAGCALTIARMLVRMQFGRTIRWASGRSGPLRSAADRRLAAAVARVGDLSGSTCLEQAVALVILLALHGRAARLVIGVSRANGGVSAHAWVECGGEVVLGGAARERFTPLTVSTPARSCPA